MKLRNAAFLSFLLVFILILAGYMLVGEVAAQQPDGTGPGKEIHLGMQDNGEAVELGAGEVLVIELDSNPSAGFVWSLQALDETALRQRGAAQFRPESALLGSPAKQALEFESIAAKSTTLSLVYGRPWERELMQGQAAPVFSVSVQGVGTFSPAPASPSAFAPEPTPPAASASADEPSALALPSSFNWCSQNVCPPVRDRGSCESCWTFGTVGLLEAQIKLKDNVFKDLAEQYLLSCNTEGWSCSGGWWAHDYHWWKIPPGEPAAGAVYESDFPYVASKVACNPPHTHHEKIASWHYIGPESGIPSTAAIYVGSQPPGTLTPRAYLPDVKKYVDESNSPTPTPIPTSIPPSAELTENGGFESGATIWGQYSSGGYQCIVKDEVVHAGSWSAWLGSYNNADDQIYQTFTVPAWARAARLQFYLYVESEDVDWPYDLFSGELQAASGSTLQSFFQANSTSKGPNWRLITQDWDDFTAHAGQQRRLFFQGTTDGSLNTNFFVDDVSLVVYSGSLPGTARGQTVDLQQDLAREGGETEWKDRTGSLR